jgi:glucokinase
MIQQGYDVIALDVGGSSVKSAVVNARQRVVGSVQVDPIDSKASASVILGTLSSIIDHYLRSSPAIRRIAFAFPGPFDYAAGICLMTGLTKYDSIYGIDVSAALRDLLQRPDLEFRYRNDAEAAILGEALYGAGKPYHRLIGVTLGTGFGSAFVVGGRIVKEGTGVPPDGWFYPLYLGDQLVDEIFSTRGLLSRLIAQGILANDVADAIREAGEQHPAIAETFSAFGYELGAFLDPFARDFSADAVIVGGGIVEAWHLFAPSLAAALSVQVKRRALGAQAPLLGAAALFYDTQPSA